MLSRRSIESSNNNGAILQSELHEEEPHTKIKRSSHNNRCSRIAYTMEIMPTVAEAVVMPSKRSLSLELSQLENTTTTFVSPFLDNDLSYGSTTFRDIGSMKYNSEMRNVQQEEKHNELGDSCKSLYEITDLDQDDEISFSNEDEDALYSFDDDDMMSFSNEITNELDSISSDPISLVPDLNAQPKDASILPTPDPEIKLSERQFLLCMKLAENAAECDASLFTTVSILHLVEHLQ